MNRPFPWKCRNCKKKALHPVTVDYTVKLEHDGRIYPIEVKGLEILRCDSCGAQQLPDEAHAKINDALRAAAGLLTPAQIEAQRKVLELSQKDFARLFGVAPETVCRWETGAQIQSRVMDDFLRAFFALPGLRAYLRALRGMAPPPEPRAV